MGRAPAFVAVNKTVRVLQVFSQLQVESIKIISCAAFNDCTLFITSVTMSRAQHSPSCNMTVVPKIKIFFYNYKRRKVQGETNFISLYITFFLDGKKTYNQPGADTRGEMGVIAPLDP